MAKKEGKIANKFLVLFLIIALITSVLAIYEIFLFDGVETLIRYIGIGVMALFDIFLLFKVRRILKEKSKKKHVRGFWITILILYAIVTFGAAYALNYVYSRLSGVNKNEVTYTSYLVVLASNPNKDIKSASDLTIGMLKDEKNPEGYIIPQEMIHKYKLQDSNEIKEYDDYTSMLADLYAKELGGMFVPSGYVSMFNGITGYENIETDTKVIGEGSKKMKKAHVSSVETASSGKSVTEPFTILLMGIDSTDEVLEKNAIANGDTLILITFNPKTLNATMLSVPRDSYVPISCWSGRPENKITHAAAYGNDCMINTIQDYMGVHIDYYAKINFKGLVKLVDAVGGVEVDVPKELCTDDSSRWSEVCIQPGRQVLNGEQALVFARNRKQLEDGDFGRARHQQEIIMALANKMREIKDVKTFMTIFDTVSNSIDTNLTTKQILSFYNVGKDIIKKSHEEADLVNIQQLYLDGSGQMIYDERARMVLWDYVPNENSRQDDIRAMKENLELVGHSDIKEFHFSINKPYEKTVIGKGYGNTSTYKLLPDFTGDSESTARNTCSQYGIVCTFKGDGGTVVDQSEPFRKRIDLMKNGLTLTLSGSEKEKPKETDKDDDDDEENKDDPKEDDNKEDNNNNNNNDDNNNNNNNDNTENKDNE